jgi:hypothetical protein
MLRGNNEFVKGKFENSEKSIQFNVVQLLTLSCITIMMALNCTS